MCKQPLNILELKTTLWKLLVHMSDGYVVKLSDSMFNIPRKVTKAKGQMIKQWFYGYHKIKYMICSHISELLL